MVHNEHVDGGEGELEPRVHGECHVVEHRPELHLPLGPRLEEEGQDARDEAVVVANLERRAHLDAALPLGIEQLAQPAEAKASDGAVAAGLDRARQYLGRVGARVRARVRVGVGGEAWRRHPKS